MVKKSTKKARRPSPKSRSRSRSQPLSGLDGLDVRTSGDIGKLVKLLKGNKVTLVLVYADWCGHCKTYKDDVWNKLQSLPNRRVPMAALNETQLKASPLASAPINGFPTVTLVGNDMKPATFSDEATGEPTPNIPNSRNLSDMQTLVSSNPDQVLSANNLAPPEPVTVGTGGVLASSPMPSLGTASLSSMGTLALPPAASPLPSGLPSMVPSAAPLTSEEGLGRTSGNSEEDAFTANSAALPTPVGKTMSASSAVPANPPEVEDDLVSGDSTDTSSRILSGTRIRSNTGASGAAAAANMIGGSLYAALLDAGRIAGPAAALTGLATYTARRLSKRRHRVRRRPRTLKNLRRPLRG